MASDFSRHHIVPRSMDWSNTKNNIVRLNHKYHVAFHQVFMNQPPHKQIERLLNIGSTALTEEFKTRVSDLLYEDLEYIYERGILIKR